MQAATKPAIRPDSDEPMLLEALDGGVLRLTLNRPAARNALSLALMGELRRALDDAASRPGMPRRRHRRRRAGLLRRARSARTAQRPEPGGLRTHLRLLRRADAADRGLAEAGHRRNSRHRHGGRLPAGRHLRSRRRRRGCAVRDAGGQYRAVLLDPDGRADPRRRAQAGDGDAADRRADRRRDGEGDRAGQPGRARRRAERGDAGTGAADRGQIGLYAWRSARRPFIGRPKWGWPTPIAMPAR